MAKPTVRVVPSDDCIVTIGGEDFALHEKEWVRVMPGYPIALFKAVRGIQGLKVKIDALEGDDAAKAVETVVLMDSSFDDIVALLRDRILGWNWTDDAGVPYPQPKEHPEVFERLQAFEILYLVGVLQGEAPAERKNGSRPSPTTSSATPRRRSRA